MDPWIAGGVALLAGAAVAAAVIALRRERRKRAAAVDSAWQLERALDDSRRAQAIREAWLDGLADVSREPQILVDGDLRLLHANAAARRRFGDSPPGVSLIAFCRSRQVEAIAAEARRQGADVEGEVEIEGRPVRARAVATGAVVALSLEDLSEVQRLSRARQDMVANLSHELRTPLASLQLLAETLASPIAQDPEVARDLAGRVLDEVQALNQMTQEMLDLTAIESGRQVIQLVPVPVASMVADPVGRMQDQASRQGVSLRVDIPPGLSILADRDQAARAVLNVLHNAVKFTPRGGSVTLTATSDPQAGTVVLHVADDGPGIAPADLDRIFERFFRGDRARGTPGTGLGLAITRHILQAHGGDAWAENRTPPQPGAVVHLRFLAA